MNNYEWFTGGEMTPSDVLALGLDGVLSGIAEIGVDPDTDTEALAEEIIAEAERQYNLQHN